MFFFNATIPGKYQFRLSNKKVLFFELKLINNQFLKEKLLTFAFHNGKIIPDDEFKQKPNPMVDTLSDSLKRLRVILLCL